MSNDKLNFEHHRWETFDNNWPHAFINPRILAKIGFFYIGPYDRVKCYFCRVHIENWEIGDEEILQHIRWSPYCPLLNKNKTTNIPIEPIAELNQLLSQIDVDSNIHVTYQEPKSNVSLSSPNEISTPTTISNPKIQILHQIAFPEFITKTARLESFVNWPEEKEQKPEQLSEAGFFHTQKDDRTICFSCGGGLCDWVTQDDPWEQHALHYGKCEYLRLIKGTKYLETITNTPKAQTNQTENATLKIRHMNNNCLLNDKVMLDIFEYFDIKNLLATSQVSLQFRRLAISTFSTKYKHFLINNRYPTENDKNLISVFKTFGNYMESIETPAKSYLWYNREKQKLIMILIKKYCSNNTLKYLRLNNFSGIKRHLILLDNTFTNLKVLQLDYAALPFSILQLINKLPHINELRLNYCIPILPISSSFKPTVNLNLQKLTIRCRDRFYTLDVLSVIHLFYPNIIELQFQTIGHVGEKSHKFNSILHNIGLLKHLIILDIDLDCEPLEKLISPLVFYKSPVEQICIRYSEISTYALNCLSELNKIQVLHITNIINRHQCDIYELIIQFPNLRSVSIIDISITIEELNSIIHETKNLVQAEFKMKNSIMNKYLLRSMKYAVEGRENRLPLRLTLHVNGYNDIDEYKNYIKEENQLNTPFHINLTHKGVNILVTPHS